MEDHNHDDPTTNEDPKEVAFYAALVQAWISTRFEQDKTIIAVSAGGIGVLVSLLTAAGPHGTLELVLFASAAVAFLGAILAAIAVLGRNSTYLESIIQGCRGRDPLLRHLDRVVVCCFGAGLALAVAVGVLSGFQNLNSSEALAMPEGKKQIIVEKRPIDSGDKIIKSLDGIDNLAPKPKPKPQPQDSGEGSDGSGDQGGDSSASE